MKKVLWLDDDSFTKWREPVGGFDVITARSCAEAIDILAVEQPLPQWAIVDLIVSEGRVVQSLSRFPGIAFVEYLQANYATAVKSVVYTMVTDKQVLDAALAAGAFRVFQKINTSFLEVLDEIRGTADYNRFLGELKTEEQWRRTIAEQFAKYFYSPRPLSRAARIELHTAILATTADAEQRQRSYQTLELISQSNEGPTPESALADPELQELRALVRAIVEHKRSSGTFDAFLCYNSEDADQAERVAKRLLERGVQPWFDRWEVRPGERWRNKLEEQIKNVKSAVVFLGGHGVGPWQNVEIDALLQEFMTRGAPVIPVLLADAPDSLEIDLPLFLRGAGWVDLRHHNPGTMEQLVWGITGWRVLPSHGGTT